MTGDGSIPEEKKGDNDNQPASAATSPSGPQQSQASLSRASSVATTGGGGGSDENDDASAITNLSGSIPGSPNKTSVASSSASSVQVAVRVRPLLSTLESGCGSCMKVLPPDPNSSHPNASTTIQIGASSTGPRFTFDEVFPTTSQQSEVFDHRVAPLVESCLQGYNASLVAYGQTGSGKTHTVIGPSTLHNNATGSDPADDPSSGMIPRAVHQLFQKLQDTLEQSQQQNSSSDSTGESSPEGPAKSSSNASYEFEVRVQFLELYGEEIRDLLVSNASVSSSNNSSDALRIRDIGNDEPEVVGATSEIVGSAEEALRCLTKGMLRRVTASTAMNEASSRSHAIFSIMIDQTWNSTNKAGATNGTPSNKNNTAAAETTGQEVRRSKFNFVDLAGSERQKRTQASGRRLKEGIDINKGLLVLGNVISALGDPKKRGKAFVPYRDSKLTRLLKGSLGGNHKTLMVACVSPASTNMEESLNCLRYANRAKNIQNHAVVNLDPRSRQIAQLQHQVKTLATDLLQEGNIAISFTREDLVAMASGGASPQDVQASGAQQPAIQVNAAPTAAGPQLISPLAVQSPNQDTITTNKQDNMEQLQNLQDTEEELQRTRTQLKKSRRDNVAVEERLHVTQAENEFYRLQLDAVTGPEEDDDNFTTTNKKASTGTPNMVKRKINLDRAFVDRASQYEKEIDRLKDELRVVRSQLVEQRDPADDDNTMTALSIKKASQEMKAERERLSFLQTELLSASLGPNGTPAKSPAPAQRPQSIHRERRQDSDGNASDGDDHKEIRKVHSDDKAEEDRLSALTLKYSHVDDDDEVMVLNNQENIWVGDAGLSEEQREAKAAQQRRAQIEADLLEISRIIESKEDLISQLQCSQAKYSVNARDALLLLIMPRKKCLTFFCAIPAVFP